MDSKVFNIASKTEIEARVEELKNASNEIKARLAPVLKKLWNPERELRIVKDLTVFTEFHTTFPNFDEVTNIFEVSAMGLSKIGAPLEVQPILIVGDPGLGKTLFVSKLAEALRLPFFEIVLSTVTASFALSGGSIQWAEGAPGFISASLAVSPTGNPIFLLDEIDKCSLGAQYNPMSAFYSLLERHTAARFMDEALGISLDASRVIWIATANDLNQIPHAIQSRLRVIEIRKPDVKGIRNVIASVYMGLRKDRPYGRLLNPEIGEDVINALAHKVPREIRQALEDGMLKAIMTSRDYIAVDDLPVIKERRRAGFY